MGEVSCMRLMRVVGWTMRNLIWLVYACQVGRTEELQTRRVVIMGGLTSAIGPAVTSPLEALLAPDVGPTRDSALACNLKEHAFIKAECV